MTACILQSRIEEAGGGVVGRERGSEQILSGRAGCAGLRADDWAKLITAAFLRAFYL